VFWKRICVNNTTLIEWLNVISNPLTLKWRLMVLSGRVVEETIWCLFLIFFLFIQILLHFSLKHAFIITLIFLSITLYMIS
jgi:hypothetical protein